MRNVFPKLLLFLGMAALSFGTGMGAVWLYLKFKPTSHEISINKSSSTPASIVTAADNSQQNVPLTESQNETAENLPATQDNSQNSSDNISANANSDNQNPFSFAVLGDTKSFSAGNPNGNLEKAVASLKNQNFAFDLVMGDLIGSCDGGSSCEKKYNDWKSVMSPILSKTYEVQGNHDRTGGSGADSVWQKEFSNLPGNGPAGYSKITYSFDYGNSHFVVLTSERPEHVINSTQRDWLEKDLSANTKLNVFVFYHEPAYQMSQDTKDALDAEPAERDAFWNILKKHSVTAVFNGHLHMIARKNQDGILEFVIGDTDSTADDVPQKNLTDWGLTGHHYAMVNVSGKTIDVKIYSLTGSLENDFSFSK